VEVVRLLLSHGSDPAVKNTVGLSSLQTAEEQVGVVEGEFKDEATQILKMLQEARTGNEEGGSS